MSEDLSSQPWSIDKDDYELQEGVGPQQWCRRLTVGPGRRSDEGEQARTCACPLMELGGGAAGVVEATGLCAQRGARLASVIILVHTLGPGPQGSLGTVARERQYLQKRSVRPKLMHRLAIAQLSPDPAERCRPSYCPTVLSPAAAPHRPDLRA
ncbi:hypothetical protein JZ751_003790, partial [Albula glossodonta]